MFSSRRTLQCHCQDDEAWSRPARETSPAIARTANPKGHYGGGTGQSNCQKRREMLGTGHFNSFSNI
jgi:hypothetical protein